ncbi:cation:proton antiporter [Cryobacterium sp. CG_9.6]|uniref:cation:proton antiporter n=1 Tax=Cryobacterium sp. CG_9.6 TaxID=2760710 RepID=UPI00247432F4|nr:cation:proton antiporter [Cryobacterium sp. CG_9.6]MDH6236779.1 Kef-type K+ transport system membrane component KefB [Cryobacterium sp. CG_9.6]
MTFLTLALIAVVALLGPLLALPRTWHLPVVLGELVAGIAIGQTGLALVDASDPIFTFLANIGFALIMFVAGSHVPVRDAMIRSAVGQGALRAAVAAVVAGGVGTAIAVVFATGHAPLYVVLLASSSAALVLPIIGSLRLGGPQVLAMTTQVAIADIACIVALPLAVDPPNAGRAALGTLAVGVCAGVVFMLLRWLERRGSRVRLHRVSARRKFALELRIQLAILFALAGLAVYSQVSIMLAGFAFGLVVAAIGEPRRLAHQLFAVTDGFLGPLFFVWLGASLSFGDLASRPPMILLGVSLGVGALLVHMVLRVIGLPLSLGALSAALLGVPVAAATIGTQLNLLQPGEAAALILGALITIAASALAGARAAERFTRPVGEGKPVAPPSS